MLKDFFKRLADELYPEGYTCELCGREIFDGGRLCTKCAGTVTFNDGATCPICGRRMHLNTVCFECKDYSPAYEKAVSAMVYKDGAVSLVYKYKNGKAYLKEYFADLVVPKCRDLKDAEYVCYVPMTEKAVFKRGYNQAKLLAEALAERLALPVLEGALRKIKETEEQKTLSKKERVDNLKGCFRADKNVVGGKTLILVDDVMTTGATAEAAVTELKKRGASKVYLATVASVEYIKKVPLDG